MFAFAIWDGARQELFLARDRLGVKPLCFAPTRDGALFGSEPRAVLAHPGFRAELDADGIAELFAPTGTRTPGHGVYRGLREVRPGHLVRVSREGLDRKDRLSMAVGLGVRVPFCDHRLVEYVWNVPWHLKQTGGTEKGLLRRAAADLLPPEIVARRKSIYPASADPEYARAVRAQMGELLGQPGAPVFEIVDHGRLDNAFRSDPALPGLMGIQPSPRAPAAFLLDVNAWLMEYQVSLV
jgi:asparagine synthetase B (glutamine-hydrolysing)